MSSFFLFFQIHTVVNADWSSDIRRSVLAKVNATRRRVAPVTFLLASDSGFVLVDLENPHEKKIITSPHLFIVYKRGTLFLNGKKLTKSTIAIFSREGTIFFPTHTTMEQFVGGLILAVDSNGFQLVHYEQDAHPLQAIAQEVLAEHRVPLVDENSQTAKNIGLEQLAALERSQLIRNAHVEEGWRVRVLIDQLGVDAKEWHFASDDGFALYQAKKGSVRTRRRKKRKMPASFVLQGTAHELTVHGKPWDGGSFILKPNNGIFSFQGKKYKGFVLITWHDGRWLLINCLDLESYVASVLHSESWPGWPLEVNKVFAVACRTYAVAMALAAKSTDCPYHLCNTNLHQTYGGLHNNVVLHDAVALTKGLFLSYDKKPIMAMFDSCCGGVVPARMAGVDFKWAPYLERKKVCRHCKGCKIYSWQVVYTLEELAKIFAEHGVIIPGLKKVSVVRKDKAGIVLSVVCVGSGGTKKVITGKKIYSYLKDVKSFCFDVKVNGNKVVFEGRGYGHHLGLCQWGARSMVRDGWDYRQILAFYYPGAVFARLG